MRALRDRERRTIRIAVVGIAIYLALFGGLRCWKYVEARRSDYQRLLKDVRSLRQEIRPYEDKVLVVKKLMESLRMDPSKSSRASVMGAASAAIQKAAATAGVRFGPVRESPGRASTKELASMQLEGSGPVPAVMTLLYRLDTLGYPLILDSVQLSPEPMKPGMLKLNLIIVILDFEQWKKEEASGA